MSEQAQTKLFPPGDYIREELEARDWTQADLAEILGVSERRVNEIVNAKRSITPETASGLSAAFGTSAQLWLNLDSAYRLSFSEIDPEPVSKRARLYDKAPVREMLKRRWIDATDSVSELEENVLRFLRISSLDEEPTVRNRTAARKSTTYTAETPAQIAWYCRAERLAREIDVPNLTRNRLDSALTDLREFMDSPENTREVPQLLRKAGIRFLVVEHLPGTRLDGACLWIRRSPVVVLSLRYDRIDSFWFTLMHELAHVMKKDCSLDDDMRRARASDETAKPSAERAADEFATSRLVPQHEFTDFVARNRPTFSKKNIRGFAARLNVHPGIVVGQLQYNGLISYAHSREMLVRIRDVVIESALTDGWGRTPMVTTRKS